jgi:hypothetical protein
MRAVAAAVTTLGCLSRVLKSVNSDLTFLDTTLGDFASTNSFNILQACAFGMRVALT